MSGECDKCGEHATECGCPIIRERKWMSKEEALHHFPASNDNENLTTCAPFPEGLAASIIKRSLEKTQLAIAFQTLEEAELLEEFIKFCSERKRAYLFDAITEFCKLHPDKFYMPEKEESYGKFIVIDRS
jgi:hypothetical protein